MSHQTMDYFSTVSVLCLYVEEDEKEAFEQVWRQVKTLLGEIESAVSVSEPDSDIARFNALPCGGELPVSSITAELMTIAREAYVLTEGLYDPTIYPLVDIWGFTPRFNSYFYRPTQPYDREYVNGKLPLPNPRHIEQLLPLVGMEGIEMFERDGETWLCKRTDSVEIDGATIQAQLDLGGIAKGYACDRVIALLRENGFALGHFVCGGSSLKLMARPTEDGLYELTLTKPRATENRDAHYATLPVRDIGVSTSVDVSQGFTVDGVTYCHIIDPRMGWPINMPDETGVQSGLAGATLLGESAALCDALTTALLVMGPGEAADWLEDRGEKKASLVSFRDGVETYEVISSLPGLTLTDPDYVLSRR
ncbi:MAG: FAD:protein FMN transferase [Clostridia bacterium]|nr:FAD:protein FMN transferase [Clostridia bacterium]